MLKIPAHSKTLADKLASKIALKCGFTMCVIPPPLQQPPLKKVNFVSTYKTFMLRGLEISEINMNRCLLY